MTKRIHSSDNNVQCQADIAKFRSEFVKAELQFGDVIEFAVNANVLSMRFKVRIQHPTRCNCT